MSKIVAAAFRSELQKATLAPNAEVNAAGSGTAISEGQVTQFTQMLTQMRELLGLLGPTPMRSTGSLILHSDVGGFATAESPVGTLITQIGAGHEALDRIRSVDEEKKKLSQVR